MDNYLKETYCDGEFVKRFYELANNSGSDRENIYFAINAAGFYFKEPIRLDLIKLEDLEDEESFIFDIMNNTHGTIYRYETWRDCFIWVDEINADGQKMEEIASYLDVDSINKVASFFRDLQADEDFSEVGYDSGCGFIDNVIFPNSVLERTNAIYSYYLECYLIDGDSGDVITAESGEVATLEYFLRCGDFVDVDDDYTFYNVNSYEYEEWEKEHYASIYDYHCYDKSYDYHSLGNEVRSKRTGNYLYMGTELEVDDTQIDNEEIAENALGRLESDDNVMFHCEHDGSVEFEFISQPMTYDYRWEKFSDNEINALDYLKTVCRSHDAGTCGLHVHVNRSFFDDDSYKKMKTILEFFKAEIFTFSRRQSMTYNYASFIESGIDGDNEQPSDKMLDYRKDMNNVKPSKINKKKLRGHSYWYNEDSGNTFEFRMFRGTLNFNTLMATLQLVRNICFIADDPNKNVITWSDIITGYEDEGSSYGDNSYCEMYCDKRNILGSDITLEYDKAIDCEEKSLVGKFELFKQNREKCIMMFEYLCQHTWFNNGKAISDFKIKYNGYLGQLELFSTSFGLKDGAISYVIRMDQQVYNWHIIINDKEVSNNEQLLDYENCEMEKMYKNINEYINDSQSNPKWVFEDALREFAKSYSEKNSFEVVRLARKQD